MPTSTKPSEMFKALGLYINFGAQTVLAALELSFKIKLDWLIIGPF